MDLCGVPHAYSTKAGVLQTKICIQQKSPEQELSALNGGKAIFLCNGDAQGAKHGSMV